MTVFEGQYLEYDDYLYLGGSEIGQMPFNILEFEARKEIDNYTSSRLKNLDNQVNEVKLCEYSLINTLKSYADSKAHDKSISSENIDGYSVNYGNIGKELDESQKSEIKSIINTYLSECKLSDGTPYLYRG